MKLVGPDKATFLELFEEANGDYDQFNILLTERGEEPMAGRTFRRRRLEWQARVNGNEQSSVRATTARTPKEDTRPIAGGTIEPPDSRRGTLTGRAFVFTAAQNNTFVHDAFWNNLLTFCQHRDAQLVVGKFRYNRSGFQNSSKASDDELWYDPKIVPYVVEESMRLEESRTNTVWCGELDILPTAERPLSGFDNYSRTASSIIPHAKVQMQSVPVMKGTPKKMLYTTGACTQRNYIQRKAGQKAEFHHVFGALLVEFDLEGREFRRQLIADSKGNFQDLTELFYDGEVFTDQGVQAINWGDIHAEHADSDVARISWGYNDESMVDVLKPRFQFIHDLTDFSARNHHNIRNPHFLAEMHFKKSSSVREGMVQAARMLLQMQRNDCINVVVESNHDQAFKRWLAEADISIDPENAEYFHDFNAAIYRNIRMGNKFNPFEAAVRGCVGVDDLRCTVFLNEDDSFVICGDENGIECGMHGHRGPNGSKGSPNNLRRLGRKANTGHTHSAGIIDGIYTAGISCREDLGYNVGPSAWSHSHIITYPNGKRAIITIDQGKWRA